MRVLIGCEYSGRVRDAFIALGHDAMSCDLLPSDTEGPHYQGDVLDVLDDGWDLAIFHPVCTYLTISAEWCYTEKAGLKVKPGTLFGAARKEARKEAIAFTEKLWLSKIKRVALENPVGVLSTQSCLGKPTQIIHPNQYGHDASKRTCLWIRGLMPLRPTKLIEPRWVDGKPRWANQTDSGQNKLGPSKDRAHKRSLTYQGWSDAFAEQWGGDARRTA
ncbi:MAG: hypothetical protein COB09_16970 [Thalassobium sp.]|nr:MAG: hypothetical protein COB09_16970 [Thalassobium sp.]